MAVSVDLQKGNVRKKGLVGFSWTTLFFGWIVPIFRKDWINFGIIFGSTVACFIVSSLIFSNPETAVGASYLLGIIVNVVFAFIYNKIYTSKLLREGFEPASDIDRAVLKTGGLL